MGRRDGARPNIVLINCDDLGYGDLGCYGSTRHDTPRLDRMAAEGVRFTDLYQGSPVCSPSRGALLTGCYPPRIGFGSFDGLPVLFPGQPVGLADTEVSLGRLLADAGYATCMVGKWHCGDQPDFLPTEHGFERYFGLPYSNDMGRQTDSYTTEAGDQPGYPPLPLLRDGEVVEQQPDQVSLTARYVDEVVGFLREQHRDRPDQPFFAYLAHLYVHLPIYVEDRFADASRNGRYGGAVAAIDWATGEILDELARLGIDDDTLVVFTSDNGALDRVGGGSNLPLRGHKGTTWDGGQRVAGIARWPGHIGAGRVCPALVTAMDLLPTFGALAGAELPVDRVIDGRDLSGLLFDGAASPHKSFAYYWMDDLCAVRTDRWKLHLARHGQPVNELYDLVADLAETTDVAGTNPDVVAELSAIADGYRRELGDARLDIEGSGRRPIGRVPEGRPLTTYDPAHPYVQAEYDLPDRG